MTKDEQNIKNGQHKNQHKHYYYHNNHKHKHSPEQNSTIKNETSFENKEEHVEQNKQTHTEEKNVHESCVSVTEFVNEKRMELASRLLRTTQLQIQTIAQHCGMSDVNYFSKIFKKHYGVTPRQYREENKYSYK